MKFTISWMVVRLPETKKYLNRDGLEVYNSLLPHSSAEIQEYVNDWLDAHPEATTTVQDGSITTQKLADGSVTRNKLAADVAHLLGGMMVTGEVQGEILSADDAYSVAPLSMEIDGKSTQDGTPTPESPVEIVSLEQVGLQFAGKNLLQITTAGNAYYTVNSDGSITYAGGTSLHQIDICNIDVFAGVTYHLSGCPSGGSVSTYRMYPATKPASWYDTGNGATFTPEQDETLTIRIAVTSISAQQYAGLVFKPQLEVGSTATEFKKYSDTSVLLPLTQALRSLPDGTKDTLALTYIQTSTREGWAWYSRELMQRVGVTMLDGSETWNSGGSSYDGNVGTDRFVKIAGMRNTGINNSLLSEELQHTGGYIWSNPDVNIWKCTRFNGQAHVVFDNATVGITSEGTDINRTALIKAWLGEHPITMHYPLAAPITTQLDPIELPVLPAPNCTVWADPTTGLKMSYMRDANIVVSNIEQAIADL